MSVSPSDFITTIKSEDGTTVEIGEGVEIYVTIAEGDGPALLDNDRLALIKRIQDAEVEE